MRRSGTLVLRASLLLPFALLSGAPSQDLVPRDSAAEPLERPSARQEAHGTITGTVVVGSARRRTTNRYRGRSASPARHDVQTLPPVVYLEEQLPEASGGEGGGWENRGGGGDRERGSRVKLTVAQRDTAFAPPVVVVPVGGTVEFPNEDDFFHNVFSYSRTKRFDLGRYPQGETKAEVFDRPGIVQVFCEVHEQMRSVILVAENPYHDVVSDEGTFTISEVPPGTYRLVVWHPDAGRRELEVEVRDGETIDVSADLS